MAFRRFRQALSIEVLRGCIASIAAVLITSLISACATEETKQEALKGPGNPVLKVRWLPPCSMEAEDPFFSAEVYPDGLVRYTGGAQTRVNGEQTVRLSAESLRSVLRVARSAVNRSHGKAVRTGEETDGAYCLDVETYDTRGRASGGMVNSFAKEARPLISALNRIVQKDWVCPPRTSFASLEKNLEATGYCGDPWSNRPFISFSMIDKTGCMSYRADIYRKVIYFAATRQQASLGGKAPSWTVIDDKFYAIDETAFQSLVAVVKRAHLQRLEISHADPKFPADYDASSPDDVLRVWEALTRSINLKLIEMPADTAPCNKYGRSGAVIVRYELIN